MLSTGNTALNAAIKTELANSSSLKSTHQVIAEWNYNAYIPSSSIGCLLASGGTDDGYQNYTYTAGDDDPVTNTDIDRIKYTPLKDIFKTNRPNPGIVHGVANILGGNKPINGDGDSLAITRIFNLISEDTRLYPISKNSSFKYWSSIRKKNGTRIGVSSATESSGEYAITNASPFIIYEDTIYVNKIVVKTQKHQGYPTSFKIQGLIENVWTDLYTATKSNPDVLQDGVLNIYHQGGGVWSEYTAVIDAPNEKVVTSFSKSSLDSNIVSLKGIRFLVQKMSAPNIPVEVIELSPRLVADITNSVTSLDIRSSVGNSAYGLPIGSVVSSNGSISLSDYDSFFNKNNNDSILQNILKPNVEIKIYQKLTIGSNLYRFPLKTMYSGIWEDADSLIVTTSLEDYFKFFREAAAPDLMIANSTGVPTSVALLMMLDNVGFTGFRFEKTSNDNDHEDVVMDFFYSKKEQTVLEVLEAVAISTQTSIYMDVDNELIAMTKEKMISPETKDFWFIGNDGVSEKTDSIVLPVTRYAGNGTTTVTGTLSSHGLSVGEKITISGAVGTQQAKLNGTWSIATVETNTFTFVVASSISTGNLNVDLGVTRLVIPYISNIQTFNESSEPPITDVSVDYNGLGLEKKSLSLVNNNDDKKQQHLESPNFGASFVNKDLRYTLDIVWQPGNDKGKSDNYLAAAAIIKDIPERTPYEYFHNVNPVNVNRVSDLTESANTKQDAIRQFYSRDDGAKVSLCMNLDKEMINTFINSYSGYVMIDTEIIRYNGILFFMSNPREKTFKKKILFSVEEYNFEKSKLRQGGSIEPEALIVYLDLETDIDQADPSKNIYTLISDGRGENKTEITAHKAVDTSKEFMQDRDADDWQKYGVQLWGPKRAVPTSIIKSLTVTNRIDNFVSNKTTGALMTSKSIPGYIRVSSARSSGNIPSRKRPGSSISGTLSDGTTLTVSEANRLRLSVGSRLTKVSGTGVFGAETEVESIISDTKVKITPEATTNGAIVFGSNISDFLPIENLSEQIVSGIFKTIKVKGSKIPIRRIGTRMRLVSDVPKNVDAGESLIKDSCIAGIGWNIRTTSNSNRSGITGYFVEIEDVGKIDAQSLLSENYRNLRFYKVVFEDGKHVPKLIRNAWVNVSSTPSTAPDMGTALTDAKGGGKSYAQIFDLEVVIRDKGSRRYYEIYWDDQQVIEASETKPSTETSVAGFITRGQSSAIYEYLYVSSSPDDIVVTKQTSVLTKNKDQKLSSLASRGLLPDTLMQTINNSKVLVYFEDFGRYAREVKKFDTRFDSPSLNASLISLSDVNPNYFVSEFQPSSFGSSFWLYNTGSGPIQIDESSQTPLWISAFALKNINPGTVQSSKLVEKEEYAKEDNDRYTINRNNYGKQEIMLSGEFINNLEQAKSLATWISDNLSKERKSITLSIFPNPILELGDKVGLLYSDKLYNDSTKTYTISSISHSVSNAGPSMSIEIRECV
jgi:hypothetical protein